MKANFSLQLTVAMLSIIFCTLESKIGSMWFKYCLLYKSKHERCTEIDFMVSMIFLKKQASTAVFSPMGCDMNLLIQCYDSNFESENKEKGREDLNFVKNQMKNLVSETFNSSTCFYKRYELTQKDITYIGFMHAIYSMSNEQYVFKKHHNVSIKSYTEQLFKEHTEWLEEKSFGLLSTPLKASLFINNDNIFGTFIYLNEIWEKKFVKDTSCKNIFILSYGRPIFRDFIKRKDFFKYAKFVLDDLEFQIVAIRYEKKFKGSLTSYMIYLIPSNHSTDLSKLWDAFYTCSNGNICTFIKNLKQEKIDLRLPTLERFQSNFNLINLLYDVFKYNTAYNLFSSLSTYINIDENGVEKNDLERDNCSNKSSREDTCVIANKTYISFVYQMQTKRILFLIKDTGKIKIQN
ncbi:hypothetical protein NBO_18g0021 [Nosema bombycis CQ1]|uniref:Serpin domain-containing protein n=1 Tax=Nosema bombycis (strain CQ1 / CVCC 102059) TaxID=578461 RepID=R0M9N5_NOSB1|nr:hypothetical protein NBO_18g0021 [Nosema bombycis CQ1]|eukprot:EOB14694.1 hypothetical protein NBO_18g0021 [Nosema bombycis CQ1]